MTEHLPADELAPDVPLPRSRAVRRAHGDDDRPDWDPRGPAVRRDPVAAYDAMRGACPVAQGPDGAWTLFSHAHVMRAALDPVTFSSAVSAHLQVPNGLDGPEHTGLRAVVEKYFTPERMAALEPVVAQVAADLVAQLPVPGAVDAVVLGSHFAVRAQSAWLGWPADLAGDLLAWMADNQAATRARPRADGGGRGPVRRDHPVPDGRPARRG